ncbi:MAG TPA: hypothetical protein PK411_15660 [Mesotoga infera]|nr:hypothetical protein [Mesotoga infera]
MTDEEGYRSTVHRPPRRLIEEREDALRRSFASRKTYSRLLELEGKTDPVYDL